jgi:hypothetical protein
VRTLLTCLTVVLLAAGCGTADSPYEAAVRDLPPIYCYRSLAGADCYATPFFRDERQFINHYGPPPREYERPAPPEPARLDPPPEVDWYCKVSEPDACPLTAASAAPAPPPAVESGP